MSKPIIEVSNLSKKYQLGVVGATTLRDDLARLARRFRGGPPPEDPGEFWALRDVSFQVMPGEVVGVIGRNGAGKSTLLKILSRITEPTSGRAVLRGRIASLLEVGTGFHQDLTGRENIFLNGSILGLRRAEIARRFDEIVAFAEVDKFIDTPVKHYSSGMYVRLAFAVAAHLEPDILIVDEVLAVGDATFQRKCLGKMESTAGSGRTVIFVSHNMHAVQQLTRHCLFMQRGQSLFYGETEVAIDRYLGQVPNEKKTRFDPRQGKRDMTLRRQAEVTALEFVRESPVFHVEEEFEFLATVTIHAPLPAFRFSITLVAGDGAPVGSSFSPEIAGDFRAGERIQVKVQLPFAHLAPGQYTCTLALGRGVDQQGIANFDVVGDTLPFEVRQRPSAAGLFSAWPRNWGPIALPRLTATRIDR